MRSQDRDKPNRQPRTRGMRSARPMIALVSVAVFVCTASSVATRWRAHSGSVTALAKPSSIRPAPELDKSISQGKLTESVLLTVTPRGFDLQEITVPAAPFFLLVENRSGLSEMSLSLQSDAGSLIKAARVQREELDWAELLDLSPGKYVLVEASHPEQVCRLTVAQK